MKTIKFKKINNKKDKKLKIILMSIIPFLFVGSITAVVTTLVLKKKQLYVNKTDIEQFLNFSNNKENTLMLYFDRAQGLSWNCLLLYDYLENKENSFIVQFPEFTSFLKAYSIGATTNASNPSIFSGAAYSASMNNTGYHIPFKGIKYNSLSIKTFWHEAILNQFKMLSSKGYNQINISSVPYYSYNGESFGSPDLFNETVDEFRKETNNDSTNFSFVTNESIASDKLNYHEADRMANMRVLKEAENLMTFSNTNSSVYTGWYFHHTHENYCYYDYQKNEYVTHGNGNKEFLESMWSSIIEIKDILNALKKEEFKGEGGGSVYDHTQILIISDHGYSYNDNSGNVDGLVKYIEQQLNLTRHFNPVGNLHLMWNNIFMFKPFKKVKEVNNSKLENFFDNKHLSLASDAPLFIEEGINKYKGTKDYFFKPDMIDQSDERLKSYFNQLLVVDPFSNIQKLSNRTVVLDHCAWLFANKTPYDVYNTYKMVDHEDWGLYELFSTNVVGMN